MKKKTKKTKKTLRTIKFGAEDIDFLKAVQKYRHLDYLEYKNKVQQELGYKYLVKGNK
tara:strand:- start:274 stop:447 length:174 start_codon:yes stop_codon:yes gene_type:complete